MADLQLSGPEMFSFMPPIYDQQTGGVLMKVLQEFIYGGIFTGYYVNGIKKKKMSRCQFSSKIIEILNHSKILSYCYILKNLHNEGNKWKNFISGRH